MSADENLSPVQFQQRTARRGEKASYHVIQDGKFIGHVAQHHDSSRTGGLWSANLRGRVVSVGHTTRRDAAKAVVRAHFDAVKKP